jgi:hypothetical protein
MRPMDCFKKINNGRDTMIIDTMNMLMEKKKRGRSSTRQDKEEEEEHGSSIFVIDLS